MNLVIIGPENNPGNSNKQRGRQDNKIKICKKRATQMKEFNLMLNEIIHGSIALEKNLRNPTR